MSCSPTKQHPRGEWLDPQLQWYRLRKEAYRIKDLDDYEPITDGHSNVLQLRLGADDQLISFYRDDSGEKLLVPTELADALEQQRKVLEHERQALEQERQRVDKLEAKLRELGIDPSELG